MSNSRLAWVVLLLTACADDHRSAAVDPGRDLTVLLLFRDVVIDPGTVWETDAIAFYGGIFDSLYRLEPDGRLVPSLAVALPEVSADGRRLRLRLRDDVRFHDDPCFPGGRGRTVVAQDVIESILRIAEPANEDGPYSMIQGRIVGLEAYREGKAAGISGLVANGSDLEIELVAPFPQLVDVLATPSFSVVPREAVRAYGAGFGRHPVGSGPYRLDSYAADRIVLRRVPGHFRETDGKAAPERIIFAWFSDPWDAFRSGSLDELVVPPRNLFAFVGQDLSLQPSLAAAGYGLHRVELPYIRFLLFNYDNPVFADDRVRRAIALSFPWCGIVDEGSRCSASIVPVGIAGHVPFTPEHDPEAAGVELAAAGFPGGAGFPELRIRFRSRSSYSLREAAMVQDGLAEIGIRSRLDYDEGGSLDGFDLGFDGWSLDYPAAANIFGLFRADAFPPMGWNRSRYASPVFEAMADRAASDVVAAEELTRWFHDEVVAVPYRQDDELHGLGPRVAAFATDPMGHPIWTAVRLRGGN